MMNEAAAERATVVERLLQGIEDEARVGRPGDPPSDDPPREGVDDEGDVDEALPGRDVGEVRQPEGVRPRRPELPVHPVGRTRGRAVGHRRPDLPAAHDPAQPHVAHQALHRAAGNRRALAAELPPDLPHAIDPEVGLVHATDLGAKEGVPSTPRRRPPQIAALRDVGVVGGRGDPQNPADRLDPAGTPVIVDEGDHVLDRRSSSAWAK
jgi:hypothetical protein